MKIDKSHMEDYKKRLKSMSDSDLMLQCKSRKWLSGIKGEFQHIYEAERAACKLESNKRGTKLCATLCEQSFRQVFRQSLL